MSKSYLDNLFSMEGKVCLITGASRGIGLAIANSFHMAGAKVYGIGRTPSNVVAVQWEYIACDVTQQEELMLVFNRISLDGCELNVLVNAAGVTNPNHSSDPIRKFGYTLGTNLLATYACCLEAFRHMKAAGGGSIINVTSIGSELGFPGNPSYGASKGGLRVLSKALANDFGEDNVRVNNLAPGYIKTDMTKSSYEDPRMNQERLKRMMLSRWGEASDLCGTAIFLASDASSYVTGTDIFVDGGWTAKGL